MDSETRVEFAHRTNHDLRKSVAHLWRDKVQLSRFVLRSAMFQNAASLYVLQFAQYILPLITVPYLVRVLGPAGFGSVAFGQSLIAYFVIFVNYGFGLSATRKISVERHNPALVNRTVFTVWAAKSLLCLAGFMVLLLLVTTVPQLHKVRLLLFILYGITFGYMLSPLWLFQGMEKMVYISVINLVMQFFVVIGIFTLVHRPEDYLLYAGLTSAGSIGAGLVGAGVAFFTFRLRPVIPSWREIWETLVEGWMLFLSMSSVSLYTVGNAFILGLFTNHMVVGYYSTAEKIVRAGLGLFGPITSAAYPRFSKLTSESRTETLMWGRRMSVFMSCLGLILSVVMFIGAPFIVRTVLGPEYGPSIVVMRILAMLPLPLSVSYVLGFQIMLPFGRDKAFVAIPLSMGLTNIALAFLLVPAWGERGMAVAYLLSETLVAGTIFMYLWLHWLNPWREVMQRRSSLRR